MPVQCLSLPRQTNNFSIRSQPLSFAVILQVLVQLGGSLFQVTAPEQHRQSTALSSRGSTSTLPKESSGHQRVVQALAHAARSLGGERAHQILEIFGRWAQATDVRCREERVGVHYRGEIERALVNPAG